MNINSIDIDMDYEFNGCDWDIEFEIVYNGQ